jgi:hypothetical protein
VEEEREAFQMNGQDGRRSDQFDKKSGAYLGRFERIVCREVNIKEKDTSRVGRACRGGETRRSLDQFQTFGEAKVGK